MSNLRQRTAARQRALISVPSFAAPRLRRPWIEPEGHNLSAVVAKARRDYAARKQLGFSLRHRAVSMVEALA